MANGTDPDLMDILERISTKINSIATTNYEAAKATIQSDEKLAEMLTNTLTTPVGLGKSSGVIEQGLKAMLVSAPGSVMKGMGEFSKSYQEAIDKGGGSFMNFITKGVGQLVKGGGEAAKEFFSGAGSFFEKSEGMGVLGTMREYDQMIRNANRALGNTGELSDNLYRNFRAGAQEVSQFAITLDDVIAIQKEYNKELGTARQLRQSEVKAIGLISEGLGMRLNAAADMVSELERYGVSVEDVNEAVEEQLEMSRRYGLNALSVIEDTKDAVKAAQSLTFQSGVKGLTEMAAQAKSLKMDLNETMGAADKARSLEGAFEMATQLQLMGRNVDALQLNFLARNDPKAFQEELAKIVQGLGSINELGQFTVNANAIDMMKSMSDSTGMSVENLKQMALQQNKMASLRNNLRLFNDEDIAFVANMSKVGAGGRMTIELDDGTIKNAFEVTKKEIDAIRASASQSLEQTARESMGVNKLEEEARANAIASLSEFNLNVKTTSDNIREEGQNLVQSLVDIGMDIQNARTVVTTTSASAQKMGERILNEANKGALGGFALVAQEAGRGLGLEITGDMIGNAKDMLGPFMPSDSNSVNAGIGLGTVGLLGAGGLFANKQYQEYTEEQRKGRLSKKGSLPKSPEAGIGDSSKRIADSVQRFSELVASMPDSVKKGVKDALMEYKGNWPIQTIEILMKGEERGLSAEDVRKLLEMLERSRRSGQGN